MTPAVRQLEDSGRHHRVIAYVADETPGGYGAAAAEALGADPHTVFKTLVVTSDDGGAAVGLVSVVDTLDLRAMAAALGWKKATMADPADAQRLTGYVVGGISPFGQRRRLETILDDRAGPGSHILVSGGRRGLEIRVATDDLVEILGATVATIRRS